MRKLIRIAFYTACLFIAGLVIALVWVIETV